MAEIQEVKERATGNAKDAAFDAWRYLGGGTSPRNDRSNDLPKIELLDPEKNETAAINAAKEKLSAEGLLKK